MKLMGIALTLSLVFSSFAQAGFWDGFKSPEEQVAEEQKKQQEKEEAELAILADFEKENPKIKKFDEAVFRTNHWINEFPTVVVIDKAVKGTYAQMVRVYKQGQLVLTGKVSTGREKFEEKRKSFFHHGPKYSYYSTTGTGYFTAQWISENHFSKVWRTFMPFAVFFNGGIAIHQAPKGTDGQLGKRASGGCVRASKDVAEFIYNEVLTNSVGRVPKFSRTGEVVTDAAGNISYQNGYKTLVIVENSEQK